MQHEIHIEGYGFRLRPVTLDDAEFIVELRSRPEATRYLNLVSPEGEKQRAWLQAYFERPDDYYFIIESLQGKRPEGTIGVPEVDTVNRTAEWGRWILVPGSLGAIESALLIYRVAFDVLGLDMVYCRTVKENAKVVSFHTSCGLETHATLPGYCQIGDRTYDAVEQRLTRENWGRVEPVLAKKAARLARAAQRTYA